LQEVQPALPHSWHLAALQVLQHEATLPQQLLPVQAQLLKENITATEERAIRIFLMVLSVMMWARPDFLSRFSCFQMMLAGRTVAAKQVFYGRSAGSLSSPL
jgi:hypothetical protein